MATTLSAALAALTSATIGGNLYVQGELIPNEKTHLFWWFGDLTQAVTYAVAGTWYHLTNATTNLFTVGESENITSSGDKFTIQKAGDYDLCANITGVWANGVSVAFRYFNETTGLALPTASANTGRGTGNKTLVHVSAYGADLQVGDVIRLERMSDSTAAGELNSGTAKILFLHNGI